MPTRCCCIIPLRGGIIIAGLIIGLVYVAVLGATFAHKNPMVMHLAIVHAVLPWVYIGFCIATVVVALITIFSASVAKLGMMRLTKSFLWLLVFFLTIWEAISFVLALTNRSKALTACSESNPSSNSTGSTDNSADTNITLGGYTTTFLGMKYGDTYGLANCDQAIQADVIGSAILLFVGQLFMLYTATCVRSYTTKLRERKLGHRLRDLEWDDNLDELASAYRADATNAPKYPLNDISGKSKKGFLNKLSFVLFESQTSRERNHCKRFNKKGYRSGQESSVYKDYNDQTREIFIDRIIEDPTERGKVTLYAKDLGINPRTAMRWWKLYQKTGKVVYKKLQKKPGRPNSLTPEHEQHIQQIVEKYSRFCADNIIDSLKSQFEDLKIS
ncbi:hypothetical protein G6F22_011152 [Rhizopus arrhizus]|nr:hypothetical protein G6F22_011152 [Rhizopus arrhizus]KAG0789293.1 hypothetical protein G6F21_006617 [Rhizopus arrhizus]KAG0815104.1 hypothetical protein G6F20_004248 [Rhizopus arrhizus]KAG0958130.1 hypothetical protein G6F32_000562 [Rhizopus arrhizus]KAG1132807.1 hypothetical protein G6F42_002020 [Rhizopus arrhizus]